jgi:hypothetical protein
MKLSTVRKAERVAKERAPKPRFHFIWWGSDEPRDIIQTRIHAMIASGEASRHDRFVPFSWTRPEDDGG